MMAQPDDVPPLSIRAGVYRRRDGMLCWVPGIVALDSRGQPQVLFLWLHAVSWSLRAYEDFAGTNPIIIRAATHTRTDLMVIAETAQPRFEWVGGRLLYYWLRLTDAWRRWLVGLR